MADEETEGTTEEQPAAEEAKSEPPKDTVDPEKAAARAEIRALKKQRAEALEAKDPVALKQARRKIRALKRTLRAKNGRAQRKKKAA